MLHAPETRISHPPQGRGGGPMAPKALNLLVRLRQSLTGGFQFGGQLPDTLLS